MFFDLAGLNILAKQILAVTPSFGKVTAEVFPEILVRLRGFVRLVDQQADALSSQIALNWPLDTIIQRLQSLFAGKNLPADILGKHESDPLKVLKLDGVVCSGVIAASSAQSIASGARSTAVATQSDVSEDVPPISDKKQAAASVSTEGGARSGVGEQTIRVEVERLEALLNLVGQLVLNKNRVLGLCRKLREYKLPQEFSENLFNAASEFDQLTSELQVGVMRTRMQPLAKLFDRYPRVIRDIARMAKKSINLEIVGKDTEVDKSVLELLADPLVHMLRNSADHGVEQQEVREAVGKPKTGTIRLSAAHQGSHVRVEITDDGKGLDRDLLGKKAVERGLVTPKMLATMSEEEVFLFIFEPGFSTAAQVSDLSGRGVGMDVVRTNINKLNGTINLRSVKGKGTTVEVLIPLTVAIMPAMVVGVGQHLYAIPLTNIIEIVRPENSAVSTIKGQPVLRLRDSVLPLVDLRQKLLEKGATPQTRFAVVVSAGEQKVGLLVDRLVGQQEVVIKPLDDKHTSGGPFSGATIREDGDVSLILDVLQLVRQTPNLERAAA
jgi:two-component system chemotaxis sensor kinase CheA